VPTKTKNMENIIITQNTLYVVRIMALPLYLSILSVRTNYLSNRLGINFSFHDLRHTHATMMLEADCNIKILQ